MHRQSWFFYGTLRDPGILQEVTGGSPDLHRAEAVLENYECVYIHGRSYPALRPARGSLVPGVVCTGFSADQLAGIFDFEGDEYVPGELTIAGRTCRVFLPAPGIRLTDRIWDFSLWVARGKRV